MKSLIVFFSLLALSCTTPATPPPIPPLPSTPPKPMRMDRFATITGVVTDLTGNRVQSAVMRVWSGDASCQKAGGPKEIESEHRGQFGVEIEMGPGPDVEGCAILEAWAGGASGEMRVPVTFSLSELPVTPNRARADLKLSNSRTLDRAEADRIIALLNNGMRSHDPAVNRELLPYVRVGMAELWGLLTDHSYLLRGITKTELLSQGDRSFTYRLHGGNGKSLTATVRQEVLIELTDPIIQHSSRARDLIRSVIRLSRNGEIARMAAVLGTDGSRASDLAARLRESYDDQSTIRLDLVDESAQTLRYRVIARDAESGSSEEVLDLGYNNNGALWLRR